MRGFKGLRTHICDNGGEINTARGGSSKRLGTSYLPWRYNTERRASTPPDEAFVTLVSPGLTVDWGTLVERRRVPVI